MDKKEIVKQTKYKNLSLLWPYILHFILIQG